MSTYEMSHMVEDEKVEISIIRLARLEQAQRDLAKLKNEMVVLGELRIRLSCYEIQEQRIRDLLTRKQIGVAWNAGVIAHVTYVLDRCDEAERKLAELTTS